MLTIIKKLFTDLAVVFLHSRAKGKYHKREYRHCIHLLDICLERKPTFGLGLFNRGMAHFCAGNLNGALLDFQEAAFHMKNPYEAFLGMAEVLQKQSRFKEAAQALGSATKHYNVDFWDPEPPIHLYLRLANVCQ